MKATKEKIVEIIKKEVKSRLDVDKLDINDSLLDQGMDSLEHSSMVLMVEEEFDIEIPDEDLDSLTTINEIINYVNNK